VTSALPTTGQPDTEILAALHIDDIPGREVVLDRVEDQGRILVLGRDAASAEAGPALIGVAVIDEAEGRWYLGCVGCESVLEPEDAGCCPTCRGIMARTSDTGPFLCPHEIDVRDCEPCDGDADEDESGSGHLTCEQCGCTTSELYPGDNYGLLCARCAFRQAEHDQPGHGLTASTFGFLSETE
jgi:hypothetical protein